MSEDCRSCLNCGLMTCGTGEGKYPEEFCLTANMSEEERANILNLYEDEENKNMMVAAAMTEFSGYGRLTRVQETMEFANRMGYHRIGIASCFGLIKESRTLAKILQYHGFEVFGIVCKAGAIKKVDVGIPKECEEVGRTICDPIYQARELNRQHTDLNIVMGLCVGHDTLFYKYIEGPVTTLVVKDRVLVHNPVAALYGSEFYYKSKLYPPKEDK